MRANAGHHVQHGQLRIDRGKRRRNNGEILKVVSEPRVINICLPIWTTSISLVGWNPCRPCCPLPSPHGCRSSWPPPRRPEPARARRWCRRRSSPPADLPIDTGGSAPACFRRRFGEEIINAGLGGDRRGGQAVIAGDHHRFNAHFAQLGETFLMPPLTISLSAIPSTFSFGDHQRRGRRATSSTCLSTSAGSGRRWPPRGGEWRPPTLADHALIDIDAAHPRLRGKGQRWRAATADRVRAG